MDDWSKKERKLFKRSVWVSLIVGMYLGYYGLKNAVERQMIGFKILAILGSFMIMYGVLGLLFQYAFWYQDKFGDSPTKHIGWCPYCTKKINLLATKCPHCTADL